MKTKGNFVNLQSFSVNDGEGIRTTIFFAGCPLRCRWCANPETTYSARRIAWYKERCISCGRCVEACPEQIGIDLNEPGARDRCTECGQCIPVCPTGARELFVKSLTVEEVLQEVEKHSIFYQFSQGGITFSGGEPTFQRELLNELSAELYDRGYSLAIETSACFEDEAVFPILKRMDLIFADLKQMNEEKHRYFTGQSNQVILQNIARMGEMNLPVVLRIPLILGVNGDDENIIAATRFAVKHFKHPKIELLPYHQYGEKKYEVLGIPLPSAEYKRPSAEKLCQLEKLIQAEGVEVVSYK